jgi:hypothetical protein
MNHLLHLVMRDTGCICNTLAMGLVGLEAVPDVADLDKRGSVPKRPLNRAGFCRLF